jgi:pimeloyl-ACP methyl ester carboxylesterase
VVSPNWAGVRAPALFLCLLFCLSACNSLSILQSREGRADAIAKQNKWRAAAYHTKQFKIVAYQPAHFGQRQNAPRDGALNVYIEGDGAAYVAGRQARNPTPSNPLTLNLAILDPNPDTIYLARPCQYLSPQELTGCSPAYWASHRYAAEVVAALSSAIDKAKREIGRQRVRIFGYSGGGTLAVLIAANRNDVVAITTLSANLDHETWTRQDNLTPLYGSLNAADFATKTAHIPQVHFYGEKDDIVPPSITKAYMSRVPGQSAVRAIGIQGANHDCCWVQSWPDLMRDYVYR